MTPSEKSLIWFLRFTAMILLAAAGAVVMPHAWMSALHEFLGLDALPETPMVGYLTRSMSALYAAVGAWCWYVSRDVRRYLPLLRFSVVVTFVFGLTLIALDVSVGMPLVWTAFEGPFLVGWTLMFCLLVRRVEGQGTGA